jgi:hypothetical protein
MTTPATVNFTVHQGARFFKTFTVAMDLTGYTIHMEAREGVNDTDPIAGWDLSSPSNGISITATGASSSTFTVDVAHGSTVNIIRTSYYDIMFIDGSGNRDYFFQGILTPDTRITQVV